VSLPRAPEKDIHAMKLTTNLLSGLLFAGLGLFAFVVATGYKVGTVMHMGPGYFPMLLTGTIFVLGLGVFVHALIRPDASPVVGTIRLRPVIMVLGGVIAFSLTIESLGLVGAIAVLVLLGWLANRGGSIIELLAIIVVLNVIALGIFVYGLGIPMPLGPL